MRNLPDKTYTIAQIASLLKLHPKTLRRWESSGKFTPNRTLGNQRRYTNQDLNILKKIKAGKLTSFRPADKLLTLNQAAQKLGVVPATIRRYLKNGQLKVDLDQNLNPGFLESNLNQFLHQTPNLPNLATADPQPVPQPVPPHPSLPATISWLKNPQAQKAFVYATLASILISAGLLAYQTLNQLNQIASPAIQQLNTANHDAQLAMPNIASFLDGQITIGTDTGLLGFLDQNGNLYVKNSALIEDSLFTNSLQLLPSIKPEDQVGRQYVDQNGNLMYFDGLNWVSLNQGSSSINSFQDLYDTGENSIIAENQDIDITLGNLVATSSATSLRLTLAGPQSQFLIHGGAAQELLTINDDSTYPIMLHQPTKIFGNLYAPQFIDSDNQAYFLDPSNSNLSLSVAGNATISSTLTFSQNNSSITNTTDNFLIFSDGLSVGGKTTYYFNQDGNLNALDANFDDDVVIKDNLEVKGETLLGDGGNSATINASSITFTGYNSCTLTTNASGILTCGAITTGGADLAEWYATDDQTIEAGDVVSLSGTKDEFSVPKVKKSSNYGESSLIGVISTQAGQTLGLSGQGRRLVGLQGRLPVKIAPDSPQILPGDYLTASSTYQGFATKLVSPNNTIGKAIDSWNPNQPAEKIDMFLNLSYHDPQANAFSKLIAANLKADYIQAQELVADRLSVKTKLISPTVETQVLATDFISPLTSGQLTIQSPVEITPSSHSASNLALKVTGDASISGQLISDKVITNQLIAGQIKASAIEGLRERIVNLVNQYNQDTQTVTTDLEPQPSASISALIASLSQPIIATDSSYLELDSIDAQAGFFSDYLAVMGQATITDLKITNTLNIDHQLLLASNSISTLSDTLFIQPAGLGAINFLAGLMTMDQTGQVTINGNLKVTGLAQINQLETNTLIANQINTPNQSPLTINIATQSALSIYNQITADQVASIDSSGSAQFTSLNLSASGIATISAGTNHTIVNPPYLSPNSQVVLTFSSDYQPATKYWVKKEPALNQFTVMVNYPVNHPTQLDWLIIN